MNLSVRQAAERIGISVSLMYALLEGKKIRHERHGLGRGKYVITEEALEEYRRKREVGVDGERPEPPATPRLTLNHLRV
jgi:excisionase family DNA binding protein